jgi:hypothetical protein
MEGFGRCDFSAGTEIVLGATYEIMLPVPGTLATPTSLSICDN